jgi:hypothetical protein
MVNFYVYLQVQCSLLIYNFVNVRIASLLRNYLESCFTYKNYDLKCVSLSLCSNFLKRKVSFTFTDSN